MEHGFREWAEYCLEVGDEVYSKFRAAFDNISEQFKLHVVPVVQEAIKPLLPVVEVLYGHDAACTHKVRCAPPGPGAKFNTPATANRRSRKTQALCR